MAPAEDFYLKKAMRLTHSEVFSKPNPTYLVEETIIDDWNNHPCHGKGHSYDAQVFDLGLIIENEPSLSEEEAIVKIDKMEDLKAQISPIEIKQKKMKMMTKLDREFVVIPINLRASYGAIIRDEKEIKKNSFESIIYLILLFFICCLLSLGFFGFHLYIQQKN